jgi:tRNA pseudouridine13 synthase
MKSEFKIKQLRSDFIVDEVSYQPNFCDHEKSAYTYLRIKKEGMTTFDAIDKIRTAFNLDHSDVKAQGLKDEDGITSQLISVNKLLNTENIKLFNEKYGSGDSRLQITGVEGYGNAAVTPRLLHGNLFRLIVRNMDKVTAESFRDYCENNRHISFINYYDNQRFGIVGGRQNTHLIGKAIIDNNWISAYQEFEESKNDESENIKKPIDINALNCKNYFKEINFSKLNFFISAHNSYIWNNALSEYIFNEKIDTFECHLSDIGPLSVPVDSFFKLPNLFTVNAHGIDESSYEIFHKSYTRNLYATTTIFPENIEKDELNKNKYSIRISFFLPTGCYATMLVKQIFIKLNKKCLEK